MREIPSYDIWMESPSPHKTKWGVVKSEARPACGILAGRGVFLPRLKDSLTRARPSSKPLLAREVPARARAL